MKKSLAVHKKACLKEGPMTQYLSEMLVALNEPHRQKTGLRGFRTGLTQTDHRRKLDS